jgi:hypothetical protein
MRLSWFPWKFLIRRAARAHGIIDPITLMARFRRFAQPSEIQEPIELVRAGIVFHARGLINTRVIQNNLDWVWPYWVERQFNPQDASFIPRGFAFSHCNLTHRNWTAVGRPDLALYPIVDPRGMLTPFYDGWSLDFWLIPEQGPPLLPSKSKDGHQTLLLEPEPAVKTDFVQNGLELSSVVRMPDSIQPPEVIVDLNWRLPGPGRLAVSLRPYNPEGIQFIESIQRNPDGSGLQVNDEGKLRWDTVPDKVCFSNYREGDVIHCLNDNQVQDRIECPAGMASAAALFASKQDGTGRLSVRIPLEPDLQRQKVKTHHRPAGWNASLRTAARLNIPDERLQFIYESALRTLVMLSAGDVVPGPYTYRRFWFRDACLMLHAMLAAGLNERCGGQLDTFFKYQERSGYFRSQAGEWDSNGQVLWILDRYQQATRVEFDSSWMTGIVKGADWIGKKRKSNRDGQPHAGLLPAGFSAEHLGPNDYYYWDNFWSVAGLKAAARLTGLFRSDGLQRKYRQEAEAFEATIFENIAAIPGRRSRMAIPAAPARRMDAGAIGSLVADYPLRLTPPGDRRIMNTVSYLMQHCFHGGGFFQDMFHSGINAYLTLDIAQTLLRAGDHRYRQLIERVAQLATDTGHWPEAVHPFTEGGCMGDGQHGWAAAEWIMAVRSLFIREEDNRLLVGSGIFEEWLNADSDLIYGPTSTSWGPVTVRIATQDDICRVSLEGRWHETAPQIEIRVPGFCRKTVETIDNPIELARK